MIGRLILLAVGLFSQPAFAQNAADAYFDPAEMAKARAALQASHGDQIHTMVMGERLEYQSNDGDALAVWEGQAWIGGDLQKLWLKTEGEYAADAGAVEEAEVQALYSRAVRAFWDWQVGLRYDVKPNPSRTYAVIGMQGLAPYWFELDGQLYLSNEGDVSARLEAEYEFRLTQRWMLQPRLELKGAFSNDAEIGVGSGVSSVEAGLRLRYEWSRQFAPYIGVSWQRAFGQSKDYIRAEGEDHRQVSWVAGVRFWL